MGGSVYMIFSNNVLPASNIPMERDFFKWLVSKAGQPATCERLYAPVSGPPEWMGVGRALLISLLFLLLCSFVLPAYAEEFPPTLLTAEERAWLDTNGDKLTLLFNTDFPPVELADDTGLFSGMGADLILQIEKRLGISFSKIPSNDWKMHLAALESGECAITPAIVRTAEKERYTSFTAPYATVPVVLITTRTTSGTITFDNLPGRRVGVIAGYATERYLRDLANGRYEIIPVNNVSEGLRGVSFGQLDAFVGNLAVAAYHIEKEGIPNLRVAGRTDFGFTWSIGVSRKYPLLFSSVQKAFEAIPRSELESLCRRWISLDTGGLSPETRLLLQLIGVFAILLVGGLAGISYFLKRRLDDKVTSLKKAQEKMRSLFAAMKDIILILDHEGRYVEIAPIDTTLLYRPPDELLGKTIHDIFQPERADQFLAAIDTVLSSRQSVTLDYVLTLDLREVWFSAIVAPLSEDRVIWIARDITERKQVEAEREKLHGQLIQSQKMEAIGILAGGVAHDFNNMLSAIIGYSELTLGAMSPEDPLRRNLGRILDAAQRSAGLTRQLLAFARKQTVVPIVLDLNESVEGTLKMLRRLIGENIEFRWFPCPDSCIVRIDPTQIDQLLANLCVNAKDAIGDIGRIFIETARITLDAAYCQSHTGFLPGDYVMLAVSDDGCGMDKATVEHIFEPFFTTKGLGQGTGLGLATVYGIVKQNEGFISVYSEPGKGTTFKIYLPRYDSESVLPLPGNAEEIPFGEGETLLLVEDDATLLGMTAMMLEQLGYSVRPAATPGEAIRLAEADEEINMFITDVVMPEMNGRDLAERLRAIRPGLRHLFMSGYTSNVIADNGILDKGLNFIQKPFSLKDLAVKIRRVLHEPAADGRRS